LARLLIAGGALLAMSGCRQDMHNEPKYVPYRSSEFFKDGLSARQPVLGTVARDEMNSDSYFLTGKNGTKEGDTFPFPITQAVMERGRERFDIYCSPCHSRVGDGNGMIVKRGYRQAANFHLPRYLVQPVGHYYDVISHGWGAMPDYAAQIEPADRWAIAAYIRALLCPEWDHGRRSRGSARQPPRCFPGQRRWRAFDSGLGLRRQGKQRTDFTHGRESDSRNE